MNNKKGAALVSICIPTFNGAQFIAEAMDSALAQSYPNLEIVVSDDASTDATLDIIESYRPKTDIPIYIHYHEPKGIGANWNNTIKKAKGAYIKFLFQDDVLMPNCIETMVAILEQHKNVAIVACKREFIIEPSFLNAETKKWIDVYGDLQQTLRLPVHNDYCLLDKTLFKSEEFFRSPLNKIGEPSTILFRKHFIQKYGYFREDLQQILDYEFCYRVLKKHNIAILQNKLVKFRLHHQQATVINKKRDFEDYTIYNKVIYEQYFWYLNNTMRLYFLKKYNRLVRVFFKVIKMAKNAV
ncbi:glycosyltransferase involved in cell wall biosynthesis [Flavobacteriaceae bacterium MAR_2010_72]|nr:glycosyltransferase involved in cell wall biosynthesis [Flavobacteriaceae bacterium MAR_2010_72]